MDQERFEERQREAGSGLRWFEHGVAVLLLGLEQISCLFDFFLEVELSMVVEMSVVLRLLRSLILLNFWAGVSDIFKFWDLALIVGPRLVQLSDQPQRRQANPSHLHATTAESRLQSFITVINKAKCNTFLLVQTMNRLETTTK